MLAVRSYDLELSSRLVGVLWRRRR